MKQIFLSKTTRPRALIISMYYHLVDFYQVIKNYSPCAKNGPHRGHRFYIGFYIEKHAKIFLSKTTRPKPLYWV